jgi:4-amino-4-deoxy-L-arabinose transferase-like glycosyltransferase
MTRTLFEDRRTVWVIAAVIILLFAISNLPWQLDDYDQAKQAFTSFQMIKEGRWLYQQTPHEHVATKPPLVGWLSAGLFTFTRSWDLSWRLPSFLAALALAAVLFRAAQSAYGRTAGLIAISAFSFNLLSPRLATLVRTDMPLALMIFLIGLLIWQKIRDQTEWTLRDQLYVFALLTVAMLIKGPIVYAFLLPGIALFQWRHGRARPPGAPIEKGLSAWPGWWPWLASLAVFLLWVLGGILFQPDFFNEVVLREFVARFGETVHRPQPLYFYLPHLLHKFAPWSVLMMAIAIAALHSRKWRLRSVLREMSPDIFWLLCWSLGGLIAMSLIPSKRVDRIFPVIPPLCLLLAAQLSVMLGARRSVLSNEGFPPVNLATNGPNRPFSTTDVAARHLYLWSAAALVLAILFTGGYTTWKVVSGYRHHRDAFAVFGNNVRREIEARHWRYEVISAKDEGLLLYLRKTHFTEPDVAITKWNNGNLDVLVASTEKAAGLMSQLHAATLSQFKSLNRKKEQGTSYVLITR